MLAPCSHTHRALSSPERMPAFCGSFLSRSVSVPSLFIAISHSLGCWPARRRWPCTPLLCLLTLPAAWSRTPICLRALRAATPTCFGCGRRACSSTFFLSFPTRPSPIMGVTAAAVARRCRRRCSPCLRLRPAFVLAFARDTTLPAAACCRTPHAALRAYSRGGCWGARVRRRGGGRAARGP